MQDRFDGSAGLPVVVIRLGVRVSEGGLGFFCRHAFAVESGELVLFGGGERGVSGFLSVFQVLPLRGVPPGLLHGFGDVADHPGGDFADQPGGFAGLLGGFELLFEPGALLQGEAVLQGLVGGGGVALGEAVGALPALPVLGGIARAGDGDLCRADQALGVAGFVVVVREGGVTREVGKEVGGGSIDRRLSGKGRGEEEGGQEKRAEKHGGDVISLFVECP